MAVQRSATSGEGQQPVDKAIGLLAGCLVVLLGGFKGLDPETILTRALIVGCAVCMLVRMLVRILKITHFGEDD